MECKNCGTISSDPFCFNCGHALKHRRINMPDLIHDLVHTFTHFEKGYLHVLNHLLLKPGTMQKRYLAGYRGNYQKPFPMFVISATVCAFMLYLTNISFTSAEQYFMRNYYVLLQTAMLPVYALTTWLLFKSSKLYYAETLVLIVYMVGFMLLLAIPINLFDFLFGKAVISLIELSVMAGYNIWTYLNFFNDKPTWLVLLKSLFSIVVCYLLFQIVAGQLANLVH